MNLYICLNWELKMSFSPKLIINLGQSDIYDNADGTYCQQQLNLQYKLVTD